MTRQAKQVKLIGAIVAAAMFLTLFCGQSNAALVYQQNFDDGDGIADVGVGNLGITNNAVGTPGNTFFSSTNGIVGGSYDATSNISGANSANSNGIASTDASGGTALSTLPNSGTLNQFTISFWVKTQAFGTNNRAGRLLALGIPGTTDSGGPNSFSVVQIAGSGAPAGTSTKFAPSFGALDLTNSLGIGPTNNLNEWTFVAVSYDGTSSNGDNSSIQNAATGSSINGQFFRGTDTTAVVRTDMPFVTTFGTPSSSSLGALSVGTSALLFLGNRPALNRAFDGWIDDVRIYDSVLTSGEIETVRLQGGGVPEPASAALAFVAVLGIAALRKRDNN